jgi:predicted ATPase/class 3 adenylate cyclase
MGRRSYRSVVPQPPSGTVTFLFTDIEGSTRLWEERATEMREALARHDEVLRSAVESAGGFVFSTGGDGFAAAFGRAGDAAGAAVAAQRGLTSMEWPAGLALRVRMGLHTGEAQERDGDYFGPALNRAARMMAAAHGGQIVCSRGTADLIRDALPDEVALVDLGEHRLRDLTRSEWVFQIDHPELTREFPALRSVDRLPGNLPVQQNDFVGRAAAIEQVTGLVGDTAVVTLTGPGGVGKTRLALQVAVGVQPEYTDGAWFVDLALVNDAERVAAVMLETLGFTLAADETEVAGLCARLRRRRLLLVLDNCEHLVANVATIADAISAAAPDVRMLATSREGLGIPAERVVPVTPLGTGVEGDAVELFVTRARAGRPDFALDAQTTATVVELCRRLDGIPLAIELAAARTRSVPPAQILVRLDERFRILTGGSRTAVARHQTLQAAVDWSYELLSDHERRVLDRLSVFAGGFTLDAAECVVADDQIDRFDVFEHVSALVDKSLVVPDAVDATRYRLLETIRQYAADRLARSGTAPVARAQHARYYRQFAVAVGPELTGRDDLAASGRVEADFDNVRLMLDWYQDQDQPDVVADVMWTLGFSTVYGVFGAHVLEFLPRLESTVDALGDDHLRLSRMHALSAWVRAAVGYTGILEHAENAAEEARLAGTEPPVQGLFAVATHIMTFDGDTQRAIAQLERTLAAPHVAGDPYLFAWARQNLLWYTALLAPGTDETIRLAEDVRLDAERIGSGVLWQGWLGGMALALITVDPDRALALLDERLDLTTRAHLAISIPDADFFRGVVFFMRRRYPETATAWRRALVGHHDLGNRRGTLMVLTAAVGLANRCGTPDATARLLDGVRAARARYEIPGSAIEQDAERTLAARVNSGPGPATRHQVQRLDLEATIDLALDTLDHVAAENLA